MSLKEDIKRIRNSIENAKKIIIANYAMVALPLIGPLSLVLTKNQIRMIINQIKLKLLSIRRHQTRLTFHKIAV